MPKLRRVDVQRVLVGTNVGCIGVVGRRVVRDRSKSSEDEKSVKMTPLERVQLLNDGKTLIRIFETVPVLI